MKLLPLAFVLSMTAIIISIMSYLDVGYNNVLSKETTKLAPSQLDSLGFEDFASTMPGEKIDSSMSGEFVGSGVNAGNITSGQMSFSRARGGELVLGGYSNINGIFSLRDEANIEKISMDKDGMIISDGSMTIKNNKNKTVIDSIGLNSFSSFGANDSAVSGGVGQTISVTSYTLLTDGTTKANVNIILPRAARVFFIAQVTYLNTHTDANSWEGETYFAIFVDNAEKSTYREGHFYNTATSVGENASIYATGTIYYLTSLGAGAHVGEIKAKIATTSGLPAVTIDSFRLSYIVLGN